MKLPYDLDSLSIVERRVPTNGIELNVFEAGEGPLVLLAHGFPEGWASWAPQIKHLVSAGYKVAVPEMRGYGASDAPSDVKAYDTLELAADMAGLIDAYGDAPALLIGHDWGCVVAWHTALLYPEKLAGVAGLCVPWLGRGDAPLLETFQSALPGKYFYIDEFQQQRATWKLEKDLAHTLYTTLCGYMDVLDQPDDGRSFLQRAEMPDQQPSYMPQEFLDYLTSRYQMHGFGPPLNWYRNFERTFERLKGVDEVIRVPAMFLTTSQEWTNQFVELAGIDDTAMFADLKIRAEIDGGHWLGQEHPDWVNGKIAEFIAQTGYCSTPGASATTAASACDTPRVRSALPL